MEISPGISSMQIHYDNTQISVDELVDTITKGHNTQGDVSNMTVPSRIVNLPIVLNDRWNLEALKDYAQSIRSEAPYVWFWCSNSNLPWLSHSQHNHSSI